MSDTPKVAFEVLQDSSDEQLFFKQNASLRFEHQEVSNSHDSTGGLRTIRGNFFGVIGPNGALPRHVTEEAIDPHGDTRLSNFINLFQHRLIQLLLEAGSDGGPAAPQVFEGVNTYLRRLNSLVGVPLESSAEFDRYQSDIRRFYGHWYAGKTPTAEGLERVLTPLLGHGTKVTEFAGRWLSLEASDCTFLGQRGNVLGSQTASDFERRNLESQGKRAPEGWAILGEQALSHHNRLLISSPPLDLERYRTLLPPRDGHGFDPAVGERHADLVRTIGGYLGIETDWTLELHLPKDEVPELIVGPLRRTTKDTKIEPPRLGQTTWLFSERDPNTEPKSLGKDQPSQHDHYTVHAT